MIIALPAGTVNMFIWHDNIDSGRGVLGAQCQSMDFVASLLLAIVLYTDSGTRQGTNKH